MEVPAFLFGSWLNLQVFPQAGKSSLLQAACGRLSALDGAVRRRSRGCFRWACLSQRLPGFFKQPGFETPKHIRAV